MTSYEIRVLRDDVGAYCIRPEPHPRGCFIVLFAHTTSGCRISLGALEAREAVEGGGKEFFDLDSDLFRGEGEGLTFLLQEAEVFFEPFEEKEILLLLCETIRFDGKPGG